MIITNKNKVNLEMNILLIFLVLIICFLSAGFILKSIIIDDIRITLLWSSCIMIFWIVVKIINLKVFYFENSGLVFCIKYYHPLKKGIILPLIEYPVSRLRKFNIDRSLFLNTLIIDIETKCKEAPLQVKIKISYINDIEYKKMLTSFMHK